jgi:peptidoglycan/xylan/chitin deacetylase (PgdA/CDA1 family)
MTTTSSLFAAARQKLSAPWSRLEERLWGLRDFERLHVPTAPALTIICDDGQLEDLAIAEVLSQAGVRGVFAVSPALIGRHGFMNYTLLRRVRDAGHEIAFHGNTHEPFTRQQAESLLESIYIGTAQLADEGLTTSTLVYPYGSNNRWVRELVAPAFECAFTTWMGFNQRLTNRYALRRIPFGAYAGRKPPPEAWYRRCIERAAAGACWPALMLHPGVRPHDSKHNAMLGRLLEHARQCGLPVRTARQHLANAGLQGHDAAQPMQAPRSVEPGNPV